MMLADSSLYLPKALRIEQQRLLGNRRGLSQLFDQIEANTVFAVPEHSVVVNLDNITFGPNRYAIVADSNEELSFRIIYYSLLYFMFEREEDEKGRKVYEKLLHFVLNHEMAPTHPSLPLEEDQTRVYIVKFLQLLASAKSRRKVVLEQLNNLPQIDLIFLELIKRIAKHREVRFEQNARQIQRNILNELGLRFDLLGSELLLFGDEFQVEMRHFGKNCEFTVFPETPENIEKIREDYYMGESAYFNEERNAPLCGEAELKFMKRSRNVKVVKKSTIMSVVWDGGMEENDQISEEKQEDFEFKNFFPLNDDAKELNRSQDHTNVESEIAKKSKILNFHQLTKESIGSEGLDIPAETVRSTVYNDDQSHFKEVFPKNLTALRSKFLKPNLQMSLFSTTFPQGINLTTSSSATCIRTAAFSSTKEKEPRLQRRVPTFVLERARAKASKAKQNPQCLSSSQLLQGRNMKIAFSARLN